MGLFNLIKLANDYNKAKKIIAGKKEDIARVRAIAAHLHCFIDELTYIKNKISFFIVDIKNDISKLHDIITKGEV